MTTDISFITLTNTGYLKYTENCIKSLEKINCDLRLNCYCIGKEGYNYLKGKGYSCFLINEEENSNFQVFRSGNWSNITFNKFKIIYENLLKHKYVCITDGDIVFENSKFYQYLIENIGKKDMLIQNEWFGEGSYGLCSGFMFIKSNEKTKGFFNPARVEKYKNTSGWDDQVFVNENRSELEYELLPFELFPNGLYYYRKSELEGFKPPYMIHFNHVVGDEKKEKMLKYGKWYLD